MATDQEDAACETQTDKIEPADYFSDEDDLKEKEFHCHPTRGCLKISLHPQAMSCSLRVK